MYPLYILNTVMKNRMTAIPIAIMRCVTPSPKRAFLVAAKSASPMRGNRVGGREGGREREGDNTYYTSQSGKW